MITQELKANIEKNIREQNDVLSAGFGLKKLEEAHRIKGNNES